MDEVHLSLYRECLRLDGSLDGAQLGLERGGLGGYYALEEFHLSLQGEGLRLDGSLDDGELGVERVVDCVDGVDDRLQLGLLVGVHLVDGLLELVDGLLVLEGAVVDGLDHLGEVVDHRDFHLIVYFGSVFLTCTEEHWCCQQQRAGQQDRFHYSHSCMCF